MESMRGNERGTASIEFIGLSVLLLIPLIYLVLVLGRVQAATFAASSAAREAGRVIATADDPAIGEVRARAAVELAYSDQGFTPSQDALAVRCDPGCGTPGALVFIDTSIEVPLPGLPSFLSGHLPAIAIVSSSQMVRLDAFGESP